MGKSINQHMIKPLKCIYYSIVLFGNIFVNKILIRYLRK